MKAKSILVQDLSTAVITDAATTIYTVPPNTRTKLVLVLCSNASGATVANVDVEIKNSAYISVLSDKSLTSGERVVLDFDTGYVMLEAGYEVRARADSAGVSAIVTVEETTGLVSTN